MKPVHVKAGLALVLPLFLFTSCNNKKNNVVPQPDTEVQTSVEASYATHIVSDIEMICSFAGENDLAPKFYKQSPESEITATSGTISVFRDPVGDFLNTAFRDTKCLDGKMRSGTINMNYSNTNPNAKYCRNYAFKGLITLTDYRVDGWLVKTKNGVPCLYYNNLSSSVFDPHKTNISWVIDGSFEFVNIADPSKNMTWTGKLTKTLANTSNPAVYNPSGNQPINWAAAVVEYRGEASGTTAGDKPFTMTISDSDPIVRDFGCYPDRIGGVVNDQNNTSVAWIKEFHPFTSGTAQFKTGDSYPRQIFYGNEANSELPMQCDNSGAVLIKGITYKVDFIN